MELISLGVTAKVVVIVEDQDSCVSAGLLAIKVCGSKPADSRAHHNQVVGIVQLFIVARPGSVHHQGVRHLEGTGMASPHTV